MMSFLMREKLHRRNRGTEQWIGVPKLHRRKSYIDVPSIWRVVDVMRLVVIVMRLVVWPRALVDVM